MIALLAIICKFGLGPITLDRAVYLLGSESLVIDGVKYRYLSSSWMPFILIFNDDRRLHSFSIRGGLLDSRSATVMRKKLEGKWLALPIDLLPINTSSSWFSHPYNLILSQDVATINYGIIHQRFFFRSTSFGVALKIGITFPAKQDRLAFVKARDSDHGLRSLYFIHLGAIAICWRPTSASHFGRLSLCIRLAK